MDEKFFRRKTDRQTNNRSGTILEIVTPHILLGLREYKINNIFKCGAVTFREIVDILTYQSV